ncbi:MAG TPA: hypothetical protein VF660_06310 [Actinomycetota bacterium]
MSSIDHSIARRALLEGRETTATHAHVDQCASCAQFARSLREVLVMAKELGPPAMPAYVPEQIVSTLRATRAVAPPFVEAPRLLPRAPKYTRRRELAVSVAVVLLMIVTLMVPILLRETPQALLRSAARRTAGQGTARLSLTGVIGGGLASGPGGAGEPLRVTINAKGEVAFHDRLRLQGSVRVDQAPKGVDVRMEDFDVLIAGGRTLGIGSRGLVDRTGTPPTGQIFRNADSILRALDSGSREGVSRLGERLIGGEHVLGFRFRIPAPLLHLPFPSSRASGWTADAWLGASDRTLRSLKVSSQGLTASPTPLNWRATISTGLSDFGAPLFKKPSPGNILAEGVPVFPLPERRRLVRFAQNLVEANRVEVRSVVSDEGFWVGKSRGERVFVHLLTAGESPAHVRPGSRVTFLGVVRRNPQRTLSLGVTDGEGERLLLREGYHIEVPEQTLAVHSPQS